ncbi:ParB N-terminal domain-containing protein [Paenochrobactrum sp. BZR 588]|uniref:ParB N-terminal domain-containing protein n=1 Tax=Paenochrobactrum TaxID=999488 RepID=UPI0035BC3A92
MGLCKQNYILIEPNRLIPTEEINELHALELEKHIKACGRWKIPVSVHKHAMFVMDGHHRLSIAKRLKLARMPVVLLDYDKVDVCAWRDGEIVTPQLIIEKAQNGKKFPYKTTRHIFKEPLPACDIPLHELQK